MKKKNKPKEVFIYNYIIYMYLKHTQTILHTFDGYTHMLIKKVF